MPNTIINRRLFTTQKKSGITYDPDAVAYFLRTPTQFSPAIKLGISNAIAAFKAANGAATLASIADVISIYGSTVVDQSVINVVSSSFTALPVNAPAWTDKGYTGDGATSRISTQYSALLNASAVSQDDFCEASYIRTNINDSGFLFGAAAFGGNACWLSPNFWGATYININDIVATTIAPPADITGVNLIYRDSSNTSAYLLNNSVISSRANISVSMANAIIPVLAGNNAGSFIYSTNQQSLFMICKGSISKTSIYNFIISLKTTLGW